MTSHQSCSAISLLLVMGKTIILLDSGGAWLGLATVCIKRSWPSFVFSKSSNPPSPSLRQFARRMSKFLKVIILTVGGEEITQTLCFDGAEDILIEFDGSSCSLGAGDSFSFKKRYDDKTSLSDEESSNGLDYWGLEKYDITSLPGVGENPPLRIPSGSVDVRVCTGPAEEACWGYKLIAKAIAHTVVTPPDVAPSAILTAAADLRARLVKAVHRGIRTLSNGTGISAFAPLVPALLKLAIAPSLGQPTKMPSRSAQYKSEHPYKNKLSETKTISFSGASRLIVTFDSRSRTETNCDVLTFYTDSSQTEYWGKKEYSGESGSGTWPGLGDRDPLIISADSFTLYWKTDHSNVDWGWKFTVVAEYPPTSPGDLQADELDKRSHDIWELWYEGVHFQDKQLLEEYEAFDKLEDFSNGATSVTLVRIT